MSLSRLGDMLVREIKELRQRYSNLSPLEELERRLLTHQKIKFISPNTVECNFTTDSANLEWLHCRNCGKIINVNNVIRATNKINIKDKKINCACGKEVEQAYVYIIDPQEPIRVPINAEIISPLKDSTKSYCRILNDYKLVIRMDKLRPLASLRYFCPDRKRGHEKRCGHLRENGMCDDGNVSKLPKKGGLGYTLTMLNEDLTKPLSISVYTYAPDGNNLKNLEFSRILLPGVDELIFVKRIIVLQVTLCILAGHPHTPRNRRVCLIYRDRDDVILLPYRILTTSGLLIRINKDVLEKFSEQKCFELLHTLSHTFLSVIPIISGLEAREFGEAINSRDGEVIIYDNAEGSVGGIEGLVSAQENFDRMIIYARESVRCPLECPHACRGCLYSDACYMLNWRLNRKLLTEELEWEA